MIQYTVGNTIVIEPDEGKTLTNGDSYSKQVFLGANDRVSNWWEILDSEVPDPEDDISAEEALEILLGEGNE